MWGRAPNPPERNLEGITALHLGNWSRPAVPGENGLYPMSTERIANLRAKLAVFYQQAMQSIQQVPVSGARILLGMFLCWLPCSWQSTRR